MCTYFSHSFYVHFINPAFSNSYVHACLDTSTSWVQAWLHLEKNYWQNVLLFPVSCFTTHLLTQFLTFVSQTRSLGTVGPPSFPSAFWFSLRLSLSALGMQIEFVLNLVLPHFTVFVLLFSCLIQGNSSGSVSSFCLARWSKGSYSSLMQENWDSLLCKDVEINARVFCCWFPVTAIKPCKTRTEQPDHIRGKDIRCRYINKCSVLSVFPCRRGLETFSQACCSLIDSGIVPDFL